MDNTITEQYISGFFLRFYAFLHRAFLSRFWRIKLLILATILAGLMQCPRYTYLYRYAVTGTEENPTYSTFKEQVAAPFAPRVFDSDSHESKMTFRLTAPLLVKLFHAPPIGIFVFQFIAGLLMYYALIQLLYTLTDDRVTTAMLVLGLSCTYFGCAFVFDVMPAFDTFAYAVLILMMLSSNYVALFSLIIIGAFTDERTIIAVPIVLLWHLCHEQAFTNEKSWTDLFKQAFFNKKTLAVGAGIVAYVAIRLFLASHYHLITYGGFVGLSAFVFDAYRGIVGMGFLSGLESFWAFLVAALIALTASRSYKLLVFFVLAISPICFGAFLVHDITRSLAYLMPAFLLSLYLLRPYLTSLSLRHFSNAVMWGALLIPTIYITGKFNAAFSIFNYLVIKILI